MIQLQFLNYLLDTQDQSLLILNNLNKEFFSDYPNEFEFINDYIVKYSNIPDKLTFAGKFPEFDFISDYPKSTDALIDALYDDRNERFLATLFNKVRTLLGEGKVKDAMELYATAADQVAKAKHIDCIDIFKDTKRYEDYLEKCDNFGQFYVKTGFKELDDLIGGWDRKEELATIAARTNVGKSWALLQVAKAAAEQGLTVGIYSGEMSENKVGYRIDTLISHISNGGIIHGNGDLKNAYKEYIDSLPTKYKGTIKVLTPAMIGGPAGVTALRAFIEKEKLDMLCIDQHSLLDDDRKAKNPVERAANISKDLKNLQVLKKIPFIAVSQQNRGSTENGVDSSNIAQSDRIAQDSTIIIFFEREDKENNILTLNLVKSRDSVNGKKIKYIADFDKGIFQYLPEENNAVDGAGTEEMKQKFEAPELSAKISIQEQEDNFIGATPF